MAVYNRKWLLYKINVPCRVTSTFKDDDEYHSCKWISGLNGKRSRHQQADDHLMARKVTPGIQAAFTKSNLMNWRVILRGIKSLLLPDEEMLWAKHCKLFISHLHQRPLVIPHDRQNIILDCLLTHLPMALSSCCQERLQTRNGNGDTTFFIPGN